jgi:hypothetical protein
MTEHVPSMLPAAFTASARSLSLSPALLAQNFLDIGACHVE